MAKAAVFLPMAENVAMSELFLVGHQLGVSLIPMIVLRIVPPPKKTDPVQPLAALGRQLARPREFALVKHPVGKPVICALVFADVAMAELFFESFQFAELQIPPSVAPLNPFLGKDSLRFRLPS